MGKIKDVDEVISFLKERIKDLEERDTKNSDQLSIKFAKLRENRRTLSYCLGLLIDKENK